MIDTQLHSYTCSQRWEIYCRAGPTKLLPKVLLTTALADAPENEFVSCRIPQLPHLHLAFVGQYFSSDGKYCD